MFTRNRLCTTPVRMTRMGMGRSNVRTSLPKRHPVYREPLSAGGRAMG